MAKYRLGDEDRARLGGPEWLVLDLLGATLDDVTELSDRFVFDMEDWPEPLFGREGADGKRKAPKWRMQAALWMALRQAGVAATWEDVGKVAILRVRVRDDEAGKAPPDPSASSGSTPPESSETSTTPPSSTSSPDSASTS